MVSESQSKYAGGGEIETLKKGIRLCRGVRSQGGRAKQCHRCRGQCCEAHALRAPIAHARARPSRDPAAPVTKAARSAQRAPRGRPVAAARSAEPGRRACAYLHSPRRRGSLSPCAAGTSRLGPMARAVLRRQRRRKRLGGPKRKGCPPRRGRSCSGRRRAPRRGAHGARESRGAGAQGEVLPGCA